VGFLFVRCSIWCSFGRCDAEIAETCCVLMCPPTKARYCEQSRRETAVHCSGYCYVLVVSPRGFFAQGRPFVQFHGTHRFSVSMHNRMCIYSSGCYCCSTWLWAPSCVRVVGLVFTITTDQLTDAATRLTERLSGFRLWPLSNLPPRTAFALETCTGQLNISPSLSI
jgi:hypothetical protein